MLKSVLKCIESIRIKKMVKIFQNSESNLGGGGGGSGSGVRAGCGLPRRCRAGRGG